MGSDHTPRGHQPPVPIGSKLGAAFERMEERIRERAYELFTRRSPEEGDAVADWMTAQTELLTPVEFVVKEHKHHLRVEAKLKGFNPTDIEVEVGPGELRVFGSHESSRRGEKHGVASASRESRHFFQVVPLPCDVELDDGEARMLKNGKLSIKLSKKRHAA